MASTIAGRKMRVTGALRGATRAEAGGGAAPGPDPDLKAAAAADPDMKALLDVFPLEIRSVEKLEGK